jgi:hypothetical protein
LIIKEAAMKTFYAALRLFAAIPLLITGCKTQILPAQTEERSAQKSASYEAILGKPISDHAVIDFIVHNNCSTADQFQLCKEAGMALWVDTNQIVTMVYLYAGGADGFKRYRGDLPFGLSFYDPMWRVQEKIRNSNAGNNSSQQTGLPDEASSPDHLHYWAIYRGLGMTIIYNSPSADEDAYIYAILVSM